MVQTDRVEESVEEKTEAGISWEARPYREGDIPAIVALSNAVDAAYNLQEGVGIDEFTRRLESPRSEPEKQIVLFERAGGESSDLLGFGRISYDNDDDANERIYYIMMELHPSAEGIGLENEIASRLLDMVRDYEAGSSLEKMEKVTLKSYTREEMRYKRELWQSLGMKPVRHYFVMARPLDEPIDEPTPVDGAIARPYRTPDDHEAARDSFNSSFEDHYDHHPIPPEDWAHFVGLPTTRTDLSWLAEAEGAPERIVGFCICAIYDEDNTLRGVREGWIDILGTTRECRRKGLGRALLLHGLHSLRAAGMETALLGVDSESPTGANRLYESVGFRIRSREIQYDRPLEQ